MYKLSVVLALTATTQASQEDMEVLLISDAKKLWQSGVEKTKQAGKVLKATNPDLYEKTKPIRDIYKANKKYKDEELNELFFTEAENLVNNSVENTKKFGAALKKSSPQLYALTKPVRDAYKKTQSLDEEEDMDEMLFSQAKKLWQTTVEKTKQAGKILKSSNPELYEKTKPIRDVYKANKKYKDLESDDELNELFFTEAEKLVNQTVEDSKKFGAALKKSSPQLYALTKPVRDAYKKTQSLDEEEDMDEMLFSQAKKLWQKTVEKTKQAGKILKSSNPELYEKTKPIRDVYKANKKYKDEALNELVEISDAKKAWQTAVEKTKQAGKVLKATHPEIYEKTKPIRDLYKANKKYKDLEAEDMFLF